MKDNFPNQFAESPLESSIDTTSESLSFLSEPGSSLIQSPSSSDGSPTFKADNENSKIGCGNKFGRKSPSFTYRVREHVRLGPKLSETVKGKVSLGARILHEGGRKNIFKQIFGVKEGEVLLKASQCYLSTTAGPIGGLLFISTHKVTFCSERPITFSSSTGDFLRAPYKVLIPIEKIKSANRSENVNKPAQKYMEIVTEDGFEFWFMGFLRYEKAFKNLQKAISMSN